MSKAQRDKGKRYERDVAGRLSELYLGARRSRAQDRGGSEAPDVDGTPFWVECKHQESPSAWAALQQAERDTDGRPAVAFVRRNGGEELVCMRWETFAELAKRSENAAAWRPNAGMGSSPEEWNRALGKPAD